MESGPRKKLLFPRKCVINHQHTHTTGEAPNLVGTMNYMQPLDIKQTFSMRSSHHLEDPGNAAC